MEDSNKALEQMSISERLDPSPKHDAGHYVDLPLVRNEKTLEIADGETFEKVRRGREGRHPHGGAPQGAFLHIEPVVQRYCGGSCCREVLRKNRRGTGCAEDRGVSDEP